MGDCSLVNVNFSDVVFDDKSFDFVEDDTYKNIEKFRDNILDKSVFKEYDEVILISNDYNELGLKKGMVGTIVSEYAIGDKYLVAFELSDEHGDEVFTISGKDLFHIK